MIYTRYRELRDKGLAVVRVEASPDQTVTTVYERPKFSAETGERVSEDQQGVTFDHLKILRDRLLADLADLDAMIADVSKLEEVKP